LACSAGCAVGILATLLFIVPPSPHETAVSWPVFLAGAGCLAMIAAYPSVLNGRAAGIAVAIVTMGGMVASLTVQRPQICCMFVVGQLRGYPYPWLNRYAEYFDLPDGRIPPTFERDAHWSVDEFRLVADGLYWLFAAIIVVTVCAMLIRLVDSLRQKPSGSPATPHGSRTGTPTRNRWYGRRPPKKSATPSADIYNEFQPQDTAG
jgi:hypothetical protein